MCAAKKERPTRPRPWPEPKPWLWSRTMSEGLGQPTLCWGRNIWSPAANQCCESCIQLHPQQKGPFWVTTTLSRHLLPHAALPAPETSVSVTSFTTFPLPKEPSASSSFIQFLHLFAQGIHGMVLALTHPWKGVPKWQLCNTDLLKPYKDFHSTIT